MDRNLTEEEIEKECETIMLFHKVSMNDNGNIAAFGRVSKEIMPRYTDVITNEFNRNTDRAQLIYGVVMMICGMCASLFWRYSKEQRMKAAEGMIEVFSFRLRQLASDDDFPAS
jgi:hypothetical protein